MPPTAPVGASIAFCVTGRSLGLASAAPSIYSHVIQPLGGGTVVLVTEAQPDRSGIAWAQEALRAETALEEDSASPSPANCSPPQRSDVGPNYHQWHKLSLCTERLKQIERKRGALFAFVVRLRTDLGWRVHVNSSEGFLYNDAISVLGRVGSHGVSDYVLAAPRKYLDRSFGTLARAYSTCLAPDVECLSSEFANHARTDAGALVVHTITTVRSECLVKNWFDLRGLPVVSMAQFEGRIEKPFARAPPPGL